MVDILDDKVVNFGDSRKAAKIKIIGVGGGGGNAANHMYAEGIQDVDFFLCNSDSQDLEKSPIPTKVYMGDGKGCGSDAELGQKYAKEKTAEIADLVEGTDMVFITAGMGGGTGTGAAPVVAEICKSRGILTVAIVTVPFEWEGTTKFKSALQGIEYLHQNVDALLVINNESLTEKYGDLPISDEFKIADEILAVATRSISDIMQKVGVRNVDFKDVQAVMKDSGVAVMAAGKGSGETRAHEAIEQTLDSPLLNKADIRGAKKILLNITSSKEKELTGNEIKVIMQYIRQKAENDVDITWGYMVDNTAESPDEVNITLIATGFEITDIPEFKKPAEPKREIVDFGKSGEKKTSFASDTAAAPTVTPQAAPSGNEPDDMGNVFVNPVPFDYSKVQKMEDISEYEKIPAYMRRDNAAAAQQAQTQASTAVADQINGSEPSRFSISGDDKGFFMGNNKFLSENVD